MLFDVKEIKNVIQEIARTRQLSEDSLWDAIEAAFAAAYKREYAKSDQIIRTRINKDTGETLFFQVKMVLDESGILPEDESPKEEDETRVRFNPERHIMEKDAQLVRQGVKAGEEILFELEGKEDFSRIAARSAKQTIRQKLHEIEREAAMGDFKNKEGTLVQGQVQQIERGNVYINLGRTIAILPFEEQIRGERFRQGEDIRAFVLSIDQTKRSGAFVKLSRAHPKFVQELFTVEVPELSDGSVEVNAIARDPGTRTKIAVSSKDESIDPIGALVGQRGVRVTSVKNELGGEKIDIIQYSENIEEFIAEALLPAEVFEVIVKTENKKAFVTVSDDQMPIAIGRGGQNVRLAAELTKWDIELLDTEENTVVQSSMDGKVDILRRDERQREGDAEGVSEGSADKGVEESQPEGEVSDLESSEPEKVTQESQKEEEIAPESEEKEVEKEEKAGENAEGENVKKDQ